MMFGKTVLKQESKILKQDKEIRKLKVQNKELNEENQVLYKENRDNRYELEELNDYKKKTEKLHEDIIMNLFNLQDVSRLGVSKEYRDTQRNIIINHILKELDDRKSY